MQKTGFGKGLSACMRDISKYATNGNKTAVMDITCFLSESLGSSTV
jgi:hypothetical protein